MKSANEARIKAALRKANRRDLRLSSHMTADPEDLWGDWKATKPELGTFRWAAWVYHDLTGSSTGIIEGSRGFVVGITESMEPFQTLYWGVYEDKAVRIFLANIDDLLLFAKDTLQEEKAQLKRDEEEEKRETDER